MTNTDELELEDHYNREAIKEGLRSGIATITFQKLDGTVRVMRCTLMQDVIKTWFGGTYIEENHDDSKTTESVLPVFDIENNGWRSVRLDRIQSISYAPVEANQ